LSPKVLFSEISGIDKLHNSPYEPTIEKIFSEKIAVY
jgi:hypothetical protein